MKSRIIRVAFEEFANEHKGKIMTTKEINDGVLKLLESELNMCVSDFAKPETDFPRSKYNKPLFERQERGTYLVIGTDLND